MPKVSVIMPAYNCERYIRVAIESASGQSEQDLEIVVINDGSTDNTLAIASSLAKSDNRIRIYSQTASGKPATARNAGIRKASGEFVCFLDADDLFLPSKLEKQLAVFGKYPEINLVFHDVKKLHLDGKNHGTHLQIDFLDKARPYIRYQENGIYLCNPNFYNFMSAYSASLAIQNVMVRRTALYAQPVWFPEDMTIGEDLDLWFRLAIDNPVAFIMEILSCYRRHDSNITNNLQRFSEGSLNVHEKNLLRGANLLTKQEKKTYMSKLSADHFHYGYYLYQNMEMKSARREYMRSLRLHSTGKTLFALFKTFIPAKLIKSYKVLYQGK